MKYRKKPVVIEAIQLDSKLNNISKCYEFCKGQAYILPFGLKIITPEGLMMASDGDYIIKGVKGEFYPVKEDIFKMTYEKVQDEN